MHSRWVVIPFLIAQDGALHVSASRIFDPTLATLLPSTDVTVSLGNDSGPCAVIRASAIPVISAYFSVVRSFVCLKLHDSSQIIAR